MSQPITGSGQRTISQPLFIPTLMPMHSLPQQAVMTSGNGVVPAISSSNGMTSVITTGNRVAIPVITTSVFGSHAQHVTWSVQEQVAPTAGLYLCTTSNATDSPLKENDSDLTKTSIKSLEESYKELNSRKIKNSLSSFLLDVPGEFDCPESPDTMLRHLLDQRLVGRNDFHPLSGHALLGFRLLPGSLPEQARIDPPMMSETRPQHRKRKHKHRTLEKVGDDGLDLHLPSSKVKMPNDAYSFMKSESSPSVAFTSSPAISYAFSSMVDRPSLSSSMLNKVVVSGHVYPQAVVSGPAIVGGSSTASHDPMNPFPGGKKKKEKKRNKEKKKEKKEKKKKKHHNSQDPPVGQASQLPPPSLSTHTPSSYSIP